jgi:AcrR family transcriptional regulator
LLAEVGYARLTIEGIAQRAGVGKPTIYRWWRSKADIVFEAVWAPRHDQPPDSGELASDLGGFVEGLVEFFSRPEVAAAFPGLVSDMFGGNERVSALHDFSRSNLEHLRAILLAARSRGQLRPGVDVVTVTDVILGAVISRVLADTRTRRPSPASRRKVANAIVDVVLHGIAAPGGS